MPLSRRSTASPRRRAAPRDRGRGSRYNHNTNKVKKLQGPNCQRTTPSTGANTAACTRPQPLHCVKCLCYGDHGKDIDCSADVVLRGYSGCNTRWAARVLERAVASIPRPVRAVTVFFGANDAALRDRASKLQHVPVAEYRDN
ncbi:hypothetical protein EJB05_46162, partial [Eragrostis curvula]